MAVEVKQLDAPTLDTPSETRTLEPRDVKLSRSPGGAVRLTLGDRVCYRRVTVRRVRPLSDPDRYIALWADNEVEIGIISDVGEVDETGAEIVREELARRYSTPIIHRILRVQERFGVQHWTVDSSHGRLTFYVRGLHQNVTPRPPRRLLITDVRGNRYDIPDYAELDARSYAQIQRHL